MEQKLYWDLFLETGAPEAFLSYRRCCRNQEQTHGEPREEKIHEIITHRQK